MDISEVKDRDPDLVDALVAVWESSVRDTHLFLSEPEILDIRGYVPEAVSLVEHLIVAVDDEGSPVAFMGVQDGSIVFDHVTFAYDRNAEKPVLKDIDLTIHSGETIGILGGTGSSKSSLEPEATP